MESLVISAFVGEPTWRKGQEDGADTEDQAGDDLDEEGKAPRPGAVDEAGAVGDPEGNDDADYDAKLLED